VKRWLLSNVLIAAMRKKGDVNPRSVLSVATRKPLRRRANNKAVRPIANAVWTHRALQEIA
jgi:hypothetical protein